MKSHISPAIGADIKRLLNKFELIDKHTERQKQQAAVAAAKQWQQLPMEIIATFCAAISAVRGI